MTVKLPESLSEKILQMPEYRQGVNKVRVRLKSGKEYDSVFVAWGTEIVKVGQSAQIPFEASEVLEVWNDI